MKTLKYTFAVFVLNLCSSCSERVPAHPDAGLVIGNGDAKCAFYSAFKTDGSPADAIKTNKMVYSQKEHNLSIEWTSQYGRTKDEYDFTITVDGIISHKEVIYVGKAISLMSEPIAVSVESVRL